MKEGNERSGYQEYTDTELARIITESRAQAPTKFDEGFYTKKGLTEVDAQAYIESLKTQSKLDHLMNEASNNEQSSSKKKTHD